MRIVLLGPPGAGKGTQATRLQQKTSLPLITMGDIFREAIQRQDEIGREAEKYVNEGKLVPDQLVYKAVGARLQQEDCRSGCILDGFPRNKEQAETLGSQLEKDDTKIDYALYYLVPDEVVIGRLCKRRICKKSDCKAIYHLENKPPKKENVCDSCGEELYQRPDDNPEVIKERLLAYHKQTAPLLEYYRNKGVLVEIDANRLEEEIFQETLGKLSLK